MRRNADLGNPDIGQTPGWSGRGQYEHGLQMAQGGYGPSDCRSSLPAAPFRAVVSSLSRTVSCRSTNCQRI